MKHDSRNKKRRRRPRTGINTMASKVQEEIQDDPVMIEKEPKGPVFDDSVTEQNIYEKIERSKSNGWSANVRSFFGSNGGIFLPIGVLAIAIVLAFGAIQILEENEQQEVKVVTQETEEEKEEDTTENEPSTSDDADTADDQDTIPDPPTPEVPDPKPEPTPPTTPEPDTSPNPKHIQEPIAEDAERESLEQKLVERTNSGIQVIALVGDGITHLARRAVVNQLDYKEMSLNDEQLVYAEDYLQNRTGDYWLEVGQILEFHYVDVDNSIESAQQLQDWQIQNLMQYTR